MQIKIKKRIENQKVIILRIREQVINKVPKMSKHRLWTVHGRDAESWQMGRLYFTCSL